MYSGHEIDDPDGEFEENIPRTVSEMIKILDRQTRIASTLSILSLIFTVANLGFLVSLVPQRNGVPPIILFYIAVVSVATTLVIIGLHEFSRKRGDGYFQELSDALQAFSDLNRKSDGVAFRPLILNARNAARRFSSAADLAFFPGKRSHAAYAVINLATMAYWLSTFYSR